jgi:L-serine/L-threonine ammonia-lyase
VTDLEAVDACLAMAEEHRMLIEPACGASLALAEKPEEVAKLLNCSAQDLADSGLLVIVCGGSLVDMKTLEAYKAELSPAVAAN